MKQAGSWRRTAHTHGQSLIKRYVHVSELHPRDRVFRIALELPKFVQQATRARDFKDVYDTGGCSLWMGLLMLSNRYGLF